MILYNVTVKVNLDIHSDWLEWMKTVHIPDVMKTEMFLSNRICRLIDPVDKDGFTYAIQYYAKDIGKIQTYQEKYAPELQKQHTERYKDKFVAFRTLLKVVEQ